jgi:porin
VPSVRSISLVSAVLATLPYGASADGLDPVVAQDEPAISVEALYVGDAWRNTHGGLRTGSEYLGNGELSVALDGSRALGLDATTFYVDLQWMHGRGVTSSLVGDAQGVSNIEFGNQVRLYELWMERSFGRHAGHSLRFGLYDLNSEFDSLESASLFLNSSHGIGPQFAQTGLNGPSVAPVTSLGARWQWSFSPEWSARIALLDGVPGDPEHPSSNRIRFGSQDGLLAITEVSRSTARVQKLAVGAWAYTARFDEIASVSAEEPPARVRGNHGVYAVAEMQLHAERDDSAQGLSAFMRLGTANDRINRFENFVGAGLVYTGAVSGRPEDQLGIAVASAGNGSTFRRAQLADGADTHSRETNVEVSYRFGVAEWLTLQASLQHISHPDTNPGLDDAFAVGLRFEVSKGWSWPPAQRYRLR